MEQPSSEALVLSIEEQLGHVLPSAYKELARLRNGGVLRRNAHPTPAPTTWAQDHVAVTGIFAVGRSAEYSLCGGLGQALWLHELGYPPLGVYFAPLWWRMASVATPMILGIALVALADWLWGARRSRPRG